MGGVEQQVVGQGQQPPAQRPVERSRHLLDRLLGVRVQVGPAGVADQQRVAAQHHPGIVDASVVGDEVGVMGGGVARRRDRFDLGVADPHDIAVGKWLVIELDPGPGRQIWSGAGALDQRRHPREVVGLDVRLQHGGDPGALGLGELDVGVDQIDVGVYDRQLALALAAQQVGGAGRFVVEELAEEHSEPPEVGIGCLALTSYQEFY